MMKNLRVRIAASRRFPGIRRVNPLTLARETFID
jgi:hypothetical protein